MKYALCLNISLRRPRTNCSIIISVDVDTREKDQASYRTNFLDQTFKTDSQQMWLPFSHDIYKNILHDMVDFTYLFGWFYPIRGLICWFYPFRRLIWSV